MYPVPTSGSGQSSGPGTYSILDLYKTNDLEDYTVELNGAEIPAELVVE